LLTLGINFSDKTTKPVLKMVEGNTKQSCRKRLFSLMLKQKSLFQPARYDFVIF